MTSDPAGAAGGRRRPRRATASPTAGGGASTTPEADWKAWLTPDDEEPRAPERADLTQRERWFLDERPPHW